MKIWIRTIDGEKIKKDLVYAPERFNLDAMHEYLEDICNTLDEPTPIILKKHLSHLDEFNNTVFKPIDFVEQVNFDKMIVEIFDENSHKEKGKS